MTSRLKPRRSHGAQRIPRIPAAVVVITVAVAAGASTAFAVARSHAASPLAAQSAISAISSARTAVPESAGPASLANLPADVAPAPGGLHLLLAEGRTSLYAWANGTSRVCKQDSNGNGGCLGGFTESQPIDPTVADPDQWKAGQPVYVDGLAADNVTAVDVIVDGVAHSATLSNNAFYYQLSDPTATPLAVTGFRITMSDGSVVTMSNGTVLPPGLSK